MKGLQAGSIGIGLAVALSSPVFADATASASIGDLTVTITSSNPHVAPSITWGPNGFIEAGDAYDVALGTSNTYNTSPPPATNSASTAGSSASSTITGYLTSPGSSFSATTSSLAAGTGVSLPNYATSQTYNDDQSFTLGKDTTVTFSYSASSTAQTTVGLNAGTGGYESAYAYAIFETEFGNGYQGNEVVSNASYNTDGSPQTTSESGSWTTSFTNSSSGNLSGILYLAAYSTTYCSVGAVPEPETYALMAAGLGLIGVVIARRRRSFRNHAIASLA